MTVLFTADTHFGHTNIIKHCGRPFSSAEEMDEAIVRNWNRAVSPNDTIYHLGDVSSLRPERTRQILDRLNGKIFLIKGNHEAAATHRLCCDRFEWIKDYHFASFNGGVKIALFHYALRVWDRKHHGGWHLFGHSHGSLTEDPDSLAFDIGADCWEFAPLSLEQAQSKMEQKSNVVRDRRERSIIR